MPSAPVPTKTLLAYLGAGLRRASPAVALVSLALVACSGDPETGAVATDTGEPASETGGPSDDSGPAPEDGAIDDASDATGADDAGRSDAVGDSVLVPDAPVSCSAGLTLCGAACVDTVISTANCGACGKGCAAPTGCFAGVCARPAPIPSGVKTHEAVYASNGKLYVLGGMEKVYDSPQSSEEVFVYDPRTNVWATGPRMPDIRGQFASAVGKDGRIYALGGARVYSAVDQVSSGVDVFDPATNKWTEVKEMAQQRRSFAAAAGNDGKIYAIGGTNYFDETRGSVEVYDPAINVWRAAPPLKHPRFNCRAVTAADGLIYVWGGSFRNPTTGATSFVPQIEVFNPATNAWTDLTTSRVVTGAFDVEVLGTTVFEVTTSARALTLPGFTTAFAIPSDATPSGSGTAIAPDGRLFVTGGGVAGGPGFSKTLMIYDPSVGRWIK